MNTPFDDMMTDYDDSKIKLSDYDVEAERIKPHTGFYECYIIRGGRFENEGEAEKPWAVFKIAKTIEILESDPVTGEKFEPPKDGSEVMISWNLNKQWKGIIESFKTRMQEALGKGNIPDDTEACMQALVDKYEATPIKVYFKRVIERDPPKNESGQIMTEIATYYTRIQKLIPAQADLKL